MILLPDMRPEWYGSVEIAKCNNVSKRTIYRYKAYYEEMKEAESEK